MSVQTIPQITSTICVKTIVVAGHQVIFKIKHICFN